MNPCICSPRKLAKPGYETTSKVLVVDDDADYYQNIAEILAEADYEVDTASSGGDALKLIRMGKYEVALLDFSMPGMNGLELFARLRTLSAATGVIFVTAFATSTEFAAALEAGAREVIGKPLDIPKLMQLVGEAAKARAMQLGVC